MYLALAVISIVIASWIVYRYLVPKQWRDWTRAGLVQAFIIALYAEMYGFPITLYLLARFFRVDVPWLHARQPLWASLLGLSGMAATLEMMLAMLLGWTLVIIGILMVVEGWRELYRANREGRLVTDGLYGVVRHPQYTGILLALFGEGVVHWPTLLTVLLFPVIAVAYVLLARREEQRMLEQFGEQYREYQRRVPMFFPRRGQWRRLLREIHPAPASPGESRRQGG